MILSYINLHRFELTVRHKEFFLSVFRHNYGIFIHRESTTNNLFQILSTIHKDKVLTNSVRNAATEALLESCYHKPSFGFSKFGIR